MQASILSSTVEFVRPIRAILYSIAPLGVLDAGGWGLASELCSLARPSCWQDVTRTPKFIHTLPAVSDTVATVGNGMTGTVSTSEIAGLCWIKKQGQASRYGQRPYPLGHITSFACRPHGAPTLSWFWFFFRTPKQYFYKFSNIPI